MGPKPPDWNYLVSLEPDNLEEEDVEKVLHINILNIPPFLSPR